MKPASAPFTPVAEHAGHLYVSGQLPFDDDGGLPVRGRVGLEVDLDTAKEQARRCALQLLAQLRAAAGRLEGLRVLKLQVYVASAPDFSEQHLVANGASEVLNAAFGPSAPHARSAFGVVRLPFDAPVEVDAIVATTYEPAR